MSAELDLWGDIIAKFGTVVRNTARPVRGSDRQPGASFLSERKERREGGRLLIRLRDFTKIDNCAAFDESRRAIVIAQAYSRHAQTMLPRRSQADQAV